MSTKILDFHLLIITSLVPSELVCSEMDSN